MSMNDIKECMEINAAAIKHAKEDIKKLEKARALMTEVGVCFDNNIIERAIADLQEEIKSTEERQKRRKQMKLMEELEALENE